MTTQLSSAQTFFDIHVLPSVESWRKHPFDIRLAMQTAVALNQMADYFWHSYQTINPDLVFFAENAGAFRKELAKKNLCFELIRDVAEAHKHVTLNRPGRSLTDARQTAVGATGFGEARFNEGPWGGGQSIVIELDDGSKAHLTMLIDQVVHLWGSMLT